MNLTKVVMFPTSPTIAQLIGEYGFYLAALVFTIFCIAVVKQKPKTKLPVVPKTRPWTYSRK